MVAFDTLQYSKNLAAGGFSQEQAETLAREQTVLLEDQLATKQDIRDVRRDLKAEIADVRRDVHESEERLKAEFKAEMKGMEARITKWTVGLFLTQTAVVAALIKFL